MIIQSLMKEASDTLMVTQKEIDPADVLVAFRKIDAVLASSVTLPQMDVTERMFERMLKHFGFTEKQIDSPLINGMWETIQQKRVQIAEKQMVADGVAICTE